MLDTLAQWFGFSLPAVFIHNRGAHSRDCYHFRGTSARTPRGCSRPGGSVEVRMTDFRLVIGRAAWITLLGVTVGLAGRLLMLPLLSAFCRARILAPSPLSFYFFLLISTIVESMILQAQCSNLINRYVSYQACSVVSSALHASAPATLPENIYTKSGESTARQRRSNYSASCGNVEGTKAECS